ncbi:riboflavin kinase/FMN adenylyltransferase [Clostridium acetobutylicum]|uniref:Riboflavin biosynthesis protein n=1 Tax=Clostridium acetobutylicum (strain ATCC 824 / DSM 792 / JCM 1419 / IAM 19013 / LMG 5710 / NBRC 13948 / NRRL B-527 / VKM B-1787 / 2291 / W) TaxID=272562 RepID=Q97I47_CLOAB|nr:MULTISPECIES: bifunctional riboflavin kinase/FAD synthetase [Clostridium]AAK79771.1 Riboflavin kinase/FAD synthase [Clostridium acetobutylicum ATCC 824]ADZ20856.1 bifunctional riboflavin kinase/FMN adenylyltransferase [Clostridium acetobutylicum EA 2018]AEI33290.1 bifunctional riboflavin kinase/FMN adenylyltransferase [Clostridium acetobutylicum DSM 1731]AWV79794.1 bifunctional riboflavin kinase/FAD synthetase [Clostridium acetobutylicum]MBC2394224.1 bifunctional riboflavin kinase/FAD synth
MEVLNDSFKIKLNCRTYVTIGSFDGIHMGHLSLIKKAISLSKKNNTMSMLSTFKEHPLNVINKSIVPKILMDNETKIEILKSIGLDILNFFDFNEEIMKMMPEDFILNMINHYNIDGIITGFNHRFGYKNSGDIHLLKTLSEKYGFELYVLPPVSFKNDMVSSTRIRNCISDGNIEEANQMLLRPFSIKAKVIHGREIGRQIGFPTANLSYDNKFILPKIGVYYTTVEYNKITYKGITNVGTNPTVNGDKLTIETYILDFNQNIYDEEIRVNFVKKIRDQIKFESIEQLKVQLEKDKKFAYKQ